VSRMVLGRPPRDAVLLVVAAVLAAGALLWGADRLARAGAENLVAGELRRLTATEGPPGVALDGSPFLTQALAGRYERVAVSLDGLTSGPLRIERLDAELSGVRLPLSELVLRNPGAIAVERATARARLTYEDLERYLQFTGRPYRVRPGPGPEEVRITGEVRVLDRVYDVTADGVLGADGGALTVTPTRLVTGTDLDRPAELLLGQRFTFVVPLDPLPFGQRVTGIEAGPDGIEIRTETEDLVLRPR
jgi:hypothetical protein